MQGGLARCLHGLLRQTDFLVLGSLGQLPIAEHFLGFLDRLECRGSSSRTELAFVYEYSVFPCLGRQTVADFMDPHSAIANWMLGLEHAEVG
jgi:hypothetical protein